MINNSFFKSPPYPNYHKFIDDRVADDCFRIISI